MIHTPDESIYGNINSISLYNLLPQSMFGHVICFGQLDISKCDASRGLIDVCTL